MNRSKNEEDEGEGSPVDDVGKEIDGESDITLGVESRKNVDLEPDFSDGKAVRSSPTSRFRSSHTSEASEFDWPNQLQKIEVDFFYARTRLNLGLLELDHTPKSYDFFTLYFPDNWIAKIEEQTNL
ncbi:hypothetical protein ElyMa_006757800 [Elysia marginata]|uniref:Uncharacterized protein n=1 Tax=Elysia marginata TaxID=1093978 RepID=A0AAV4J2D9_9GAST|nr:hypothetical protein ElyMa_006757800 [Elysia marginata]